MKKCILLILSAMMAFGMAGCKSSESPKENAVVTPSESPSPEAAPANTEKSDNTQKESHYPVTITNYNYAKEEITQAFEKAPEKVLAVYQNSIETLLALGLEDRILACSGLDHAVKPEYEEAFSKVNYLTEFAPDRETVTMMQPDFILSWYSFFGEKRLGEVDYWHDNGINTYISLNSGAVPERTLENEYKDILDLGEIFDVTDKAEAIVNEIKDEVSKVVEHASKAETKRTVMIIEFLSDTRVYGDNSLGGDMVKQLGADLITVEGGTVGTEDIININPDVIFVVYMDRENEDMSTYSANLVLEDPALASINAVINKEVHTIQLGEMYCSGVRTIDGITKFAKGIYPELYE